MEMLMDYFLFGMVANFLIIWFALIYYGIKRREPYTIKESLLLSLLILIVCLMSWLGTFILVIILIITLLSYLIEKRKNEKINSSL